MKKNKIVYQNWIVDIGYNPVEKKSRLSEIKLCSLEDLITDGFDCIDDKTENIEQHVIEKAVRDALERLDDEEKELIVRFYFMGETYSSMTTQSNKDLHKLASLHQRAVRKLKKYLKKFVKEQYNLNPSDKPVCIICQSIYHPEINLLIKKRDKTKSWKPVIDVLKNKYNIKVTTPMILIGHEKYH